MEFSLFENFKFDATTRKKLFQKLFFKRSFEFQIVILFYKIQNKIKKMDFDPSSWIESPFLTNLTRHASTICDTITEEIAGPKHLTKFYKHPIRCSTPSHRPNPTLWRDQLS
jgi:hypothetical protein